MQLLGFALSNLVGGVIVLLGVQTALNVRSFVGSDDGVFSSNYIVLTKPVSTVSTFGSLLGVKSGFSEEEIESIAALPSVERVGTFERAQCEVSAYITVGDVSMSTDMFLESVPDEFIDVNLLQWDDETTCWTASVDDRSVPVIVPRNYLNLYNYGFAASRDLPLLSEGLMTSFPFELQLDSRLTGQSRVYEACVIGFSNRINTILVPRDFLQEVNQTLGDGEQTASSRLIIETNRTSSAEDLLALLEQKGYSIEGDPDSLRTQTLLHIIILIIIAIGLIISLLSFYLLSISISLLTERNKEKFQNLYVLGFPLRSIAMPYRVLVLSLDVLVWTVSLLIGLRLYQLMSAKMLWVSPAFVPLSSAWMIVLALALMLLFMLLHYGLISRSIRRQLPR